MKHSLQVRSVAAALAGDLDSARNVELILPDTGVCSLDPAATGSADAASVQTSCCGSKRTNATLVAFSDGLGGKIANGKPASGATDKSATCCAGENAIAAPAKTVEIAGSSGCCSGPATERADACCKLDEEKKQSGESGCGCNTGPARAELQVLAKTGCC